MLKTVGHAVIKPVVKVAGHITSYIQHLVPRTGEDNKYLVYGLVFATGIGAGMVMLKSFSLYPQLYQHQNEQIQILIEKHKAKTEELERDINKLKQDLQHQEQENENQQVVQQQQQQQQQQHVEEVQRVQQTQGEQLGQLQIQQDQMHHQQRKDRKQAEKLYKDLKTEIEMKKIELMRLTDMQTQQREQLRELTGLQNDQRQTLAEYRTSQFSETKKYINHVAALALGRNQNTDDSERESISSRNSSVQDEDDQ